MNEIWHIEVRLMCAGRVFGLNWREYSDQPQKLRLILFWVPFSLKRRQRIKEKKSEKKRGMTPIRHRWTQLKKMGPVTCEIRRLLHIRHCRIHGETHWDPAITGLIYTLIQVIRYFNIVPQIQLRPCFYPGDSSISGVLDLQFSGMSLFILVLKKWKTWKAAAKA